MIQLTMKQWDRLHARLSEEYRDRPSVLIMRSVMKRELGFTVRKHHAWLPADPRADNPAGYRGHYRDQIFLDFYDDALETWFRLKYVE